MNVLALDTATEACSVALLSGGQMYEEFVVAPRQHNRLLFGMCDRLLGRAGLRCDQLNALAFGRGPGAFTGVRIAAAAVQGIAYAHRLPVAAVSELAALAQQLFDECDETHALAAIDARMGEVYYGLFRRNVEGLAEAESKEDVIAADRITGGETFSGCAGGTGLAAYPTLAAAAAVRRSDLLPHAAAILKLALPKISSGETVSPEQALPVYLRDRVV